MLSVPRLLVLLLLFGFSATEEAQTVDLDTNTVTEIDPLLGLNSDSNADPNASAGKSTNVNEGENTNTRAKFNSVANIGQDSDSDKNAIADTDDNSNARKIANSDSKSDSGVNITDQDTNTNPDANDNVTANDDTGAQAGLPGNDDPDYEEAILLPDIVDLDHVICDLCDCNRDIVNCRSRHLSTPFEAEHWNGLRKLYTQDISNVDLSGNHFVTLSQFPMLPIRRLNLSHCGIVALEEGTFSNLEYLTELDLSSNKMSFAIGKRVFLGIAREGTRPMPFSYLRYLSLAHNDIHSLCQDIFMYMPHLSFLDLSGNPLIAIDQVTMGALADLMRLKELRISQCELETLPTGIFRRLRSLQRLDLSGNSFKEVPKAVGEATNLLYLNFNGNPLETLSERSAISSLIRLQELHLSQLSKFRSIAEGALGGLENLVKLNMSYNPRLTTLHPKFMEWEDDLDVERWPLLEEFYLNNNNISAIDSRFLERWDHLNHVNFAANPYVCDCRNQWVVDVLVPLIATMANASAAKMICRRPYDYRGLSFAQLHESRRELTCTENENVSATGTDVETAVLYGVLIGTIVSFPILLIVVILWKRGCFARYREKMISSKEYDDDEESAL